MNDLLHNIKVAFALLLQHGRWLGWVGVQVPERHEIWTRKSSLSNRLMRLKAHQMPKKWLVAVIDKISQLWKVITAANILSFITNDKKYGVHVTKYWSGMCAFMYVIGRMMMMMLLRCSRSWARFNPALFWQKPLKALSWSGMHAFHFKVKAETGLYCETKHVNNNFFVAWQERIFQETTP